RWILLDEEQTAQFDKIIGGQGAFEPDTSLVYTIKPAGQDKRIKAYITNSLYQVDPREDDQGQKWKLQLVEAQEEGNKRYFLYNPGSKKCLTIQKWSGEETSTAQALKNTRMLAKDETNINQQLSLKSVEVDFSAEVPVRYITIENDHPVMLDTILDERPYRLQILTETTQIGNFFDVDGVRDSQRWVLIPDQVQTALPDATTLGVDLFYHDGLLHYRLPENCSLEVFTLTGQLLYKTQALSGNGELLLDKGVYMVRVRQQLNTEVFKILAR
ncbi:MAG: T9SS type A sorting domain-containing protein, partial [Bacteroidales bacterium]|nr:T9SS type A sorting domain-containing protein [Bacteroidales bacterium]